MGARSFSRELNRKKPNGKPTELWEEAVAQVGNGRLEGPRPGAWSSKLLANGKEVVANPAYRLGVQQADKLRAVGDLQVNTVHSGFTARF